MSRITNCSKVNLEFKPEIKHRKKLKFYFQWYKSMLAFYKGTVAWVGKLAFLGYLTPLGVTTEYGLTIPYHRLMFGHANFHPLVQDFDNVNNEVLLK